MKLLKSTWLSLVLLISAIIWLGIYGVYSRGADEVNKFSSEETKILAQCLTDKGYKLYGAYWCGHCQEQKEMFGAAVTLLNYIECSTPDGKSQAEVCTAAGVELYPSWGLPNGKIIPGVMTLQDLAKTSGCLVK